MSEAHAGNSLAVGPENHSLARTTVRVMLAYDRPITANVKIRRRPFGLAVLYPALVLALSLVFFIAPQRSGAQAVAQIFAPFLFLPLVLLVPFAFVRGAAALRVVLLLCLVAFGASYMPRVSLFAPTAAPDAPRVSVLTWNVYAGNTDHAEIRRTLLARPAGVVVLQELDWAGLDADEGIARIYPYRLADASEVPPGMVLLSAYPIVDYGTLDGPRDIWDIPRLMWARLDLGNGRTVTVVNAHPISPYSFGRGCALPICYNSDWRDEQIAAMRSDYIAGMLAGGEPFILAGDFNVTEREPAYVELSRGMKDAFASVGTGFGTTWRPGFLMDQGMALLRIDYLFSSPGISPLHVTTDCSTGDSDHCTVLGEFALD
jgi:vancomycin resistance protein VanJ